ncbi:MAG: hypothetical protein ACXW15_10725 [Acidimicrobiia bacterium]
MEAGFPCYYTSNVGASRSLIGIERHRPRTVLPHGDSHDQKRLAARVFQPDLHLICDIRGHCCQVAYSNIVYLEGDARTVVVDRRVRYVEFDCPDFPVLVRTG